MAAANATAATAAASNTHAYGRNSVPKKIAFRSTANTIPAAKPEPTRRKTTPIPKHNQAAASDTANTLDIRNATSPPPNSDFQTHTPQK